MDTKETLAIAATLFSGIAPIFLQVQDDDVTSKDVQQLFQHCVEAVILQEAALDRAKAALVTEAKSTVDINL